MNINWVYFSERKTPPGEIKIFLEKQKLQLVPLHEITELNSYLIEENQTIVFLEGNTGEDVYELCQEISAAHPQAYIILIVPEERENLRKAMLVGASDSLHSFYTLDELAEAIGHAKKFMQHRAKADHNVKSLNEKSKVIGVSSPKGGIGRTVVTVNLAIALARMGKKVAVVDGNLQFGEVAIYYNVKPKRTIYEWVKEAYGRPDYSITQYMSTVEGDVSVLSAPPRPEFFEGITENHIREAVTQLKETFDVVLIDMPVYLSEIHLTFLDMANDILLLTLNEISGLRLCQLYRDTLEAINLKEKLKIILNRSVKGHGLDVGKIQEILDMPVFHTLPEQGNVVADSIKTGKPFMVSNSRSQIGKAVNKLSQKFIDEKSNEVLDGKKEKKWFQLSK